MVDFDNENYKIKTILNTKIGLYFYNYNGMVCNKTNIPYGFGRAIDIDNKWFYDG